LKQNFWFSLDQIYQNDSKEEPDKFQDGDDAESYEETSISANSRDEIKPGLAGFCWIFNDSWRGKENIENSDVTVVGIIDPIKIDWFKIKMILQKKWHTVVS